MAKRMLALGVLILVLAVVILWPAPRRFREALANDQQRQLAQQAIDLAAVDWKATVDMAVADLQACIRFPTVNPPGNTKAAAELLAGHLQAEGISAQIEETAPAALTWSAAFRELPRNRPLPMAYYERARVLQR